MRKNLRQLLPDPRLVPDAHPFDRKLASQESLHGTLGIIKPATRNVSIDQTTTRLEERDHVRQDVTVVAIVAADMLAGKTLDATDWKRLAQAAARIGKARDHLR